MKALSVYLFVLLLMPYCAAQAQGQDTTREEARNEPSGVIRGRLDDNNPREVFYIDGLRGEVIQFELRVIDGDLDLTLAVFDNTGNLELQRDDVGGAPGITQDLTLRATGRYFVVVSRFGQSLGTTSGRYELNMVRAGVLSEQGSALRFGDSVIGTIGDGEPQVYYTFQAEQGDILTISMVRSSGTLDPYLKVVDKERYAMADNDDQAGAETRNARIEALVIDEAGTYVIVASRYREAAGDSSGSFVLTIEEAENSGTGSSQLAPLPIRYGESRTAVLSHQQYERFYTFNAQKDDLITISMSRGSSGELDSYLILADEHFTPIFEDDDSGGRPNAKIADYRIPADGRYHIIATRFERSKGTTIGSYQISFDAVGSAFDKIPADAATINYGTSVTGVISAEDDHDLYAFYARQGERVTISMTRVDGDLDTFLELRDAAQEVLLSNDDGGNGQNSLIDNYTIPFSGLYFIRAGRFSLGSGNPNTTGTYVLVLAERYS